MDFQVLSRLAKIAITLRRACLCKLVLRQAKAGGHYVTIEEDFMLGPLNFVDTEKGYTNIIQ